MATYATLIGNEVESSTLPRTQVYKATHDGSLRLPFMQRSFISFTYGGKPIEDFNLIATTAQDRMEREGYASFDDLTTTYDTIQGQFYWGTYYRTNSITFDLATDEILQKDLDAFKKWFIAGATKELILAEHPNRAIMARVANPPALHLLPFETKATLNIGEITYTTSTTAYRGEITLELVMDEPFWYAKQNILGIQNTNEGYYDQSWVDANNNITTVLNSPDALKIIYEDGIPLGSAAQTSVFLGGDMFATVVYKLAYRIAQAIPLDEGSTDEPTAYKNGKNGPDAEAYFNNGDDIMYGDVYRFPGETPGTYEKYYCGAVIATLNGEDQVSGARIAGTNVTSTEGNSFGTDLPVSEKANLYYAGTAPAPVSLYFTLYPIINSETKLITSPWNRYADSNPPYNTIELFSTKEHNFSFTLPDLYASYNEAIILVDTLVADKQAWLALREEIRDNIKHPGVRAWVNRVLDKYDSMGGEGTISGAIDSIKDDIKTGISYLLKDETGEILPASFNFDGRTGRATGTFKYRQATEIANSETQWSNYGVNNFVTTEEDVGNMVRSNYLILDERNVLDDKYQIQGWSEANPEHAYYVKHNIENGLFSVRFEFQNLYL